MQPSRCDEVDEGEGEGSKGTCRDRDIEAGDKTLMTRRRRGEGVAVGDHADFNNHDDDHSPPLSPQIVIADTSKREDMARVVEAAMDVP
jgi:hypothetical protein